MKLVPKNIYHVEWSDTFTESKWQDVSDIQETAKDVGGWIKTVGFYVGSFGDFEVFSGNTNENNKVCLDYSSVTYIPRGCIKNILKLKK